MDTSPKSSKRILTYHSPKHELHAPQTEFLHGKIVSYHEIPRRIDNLKNSLIQANLIDLHQPALTITKDIISQTHSPQMIAYFEHLAAYVQGYVKSDFAIFNMADQTGDDPYYYETVYPAKMVRNQQHADWAHQRGIYFYDTTCPVGVNTWTAILESANLAYEGAKALLNGEKRVYTLCRPPGHHAGYDFAGGYCYVNNAAVAANALKPMGKVAILDIDYHHGNGTQDIFWNDPEVLFVSIHADPQVDYPYYSGYSEEIGGAEALGTTVNFPLPHNTGESGFMSALQESLTQIQNFSPGSLVVSLGFDTFKEDPIGLFNLELSSYQRIGEMIASLGLPTLYAQEGGYAVDSLGDMSFSFFSGVANARGVG